MTHDDAATSLAELGNSLRLAIFRYLVKAGYQGAAVGEIQRDLDIPGSTLSHHLSRMAHAGLITQERHGRTVRCSPNFGHLSALIHFLRDECCLGHADDGVVASEKLDEGCQTIGH